MRGSSLLGQLAFAILRDVESVGPATTDKIEPYHEAAGRAFSLSAPLYDAEQSANHIARWSRVRSLQALTSAFKPGDRVLELGCGTGEEALYLARRGINVVATDAAPGMIAQLEGKLAQTSGLTGTVTPLILPAGRISELVATCGAGGLDGAYSSFGPLNCEPTLEPVARALAQMVRPGGRVVLSLINRYCLWETAWYLAARQPRLAFRRWRGVSEATVRAAWQHERITIFYWTPGQVERTFRPYFHAATRMALPWVLPPQYLDGLVRQRPPLFRRLARMDRRLAHVWPFYALGDHFLLEMARVGV